MKETCNKNIYNNHKVHVQQTEELKKIKKLKCILLLCSPANLSKHNIYALFGRLKHTLVGFISSYLMHHSIILWNSPSMHSVNK